MCRNRLPRLVRLIDHAGAWDTCFEMFSFYPPGRMSGDGLPIRVLLRLLVCSDGCQQVRWFSRVPMSACDAKLLKWSADASVQYWDLWCLAGANEAAPVFSMF